ncbi:outer membrane protein assembly factor BamC [Candidatus Palauibacter sp.]|uniref:outer membrane protein assembly factor BamC n=1 Tax=Candidatus Palauibacter sp. TaxID=3101350 RepID=UPI003AF2ED53
MGSDLCKMLAVMLFVGCVPTVEPQQHSFDPSFVVMATEADTWDAVVDVFGDRGWSITSMDRAGGFMVTDWVQVHNRPSWLDCGSYKWPQNRGEARFNMRIQPEPEGGVTKVTVRTSMRGEMPNVRVTSGMFSSEHGGGYKSCYSTGAVEEQIKADLLRRLPAI